MKLKHWVVLLFAIVGVIAVFHYFQHQGGVGLGGSLSYGNGRLGAKVGAG